MMSTISCERDCSYCDKISAKNPSTSHSLSCHHIYSTEFEASLAEADSITLHQSVFASTRLHDRLQLAIQQGRRFFVRIDHYSQKDLEAMHAWDPWVTGYEVLPSRLYPTSLYLQQLPSFVQKKLQLNFLPQDEQNPELFNSLEIGAQWNWLQQYPALAQKPVRSPTLNAVTKSSPPETTSPRLPLWLEDHVFLWQRRYWIALEKLGKKAMAVFWKFHAHFWQGYSVARIVRGQSYAFAVKTYWFFWAPLYSGGIKIYWRLFRAKHWFISNIKNPLHMFCIRFFWGLYQKILAPTFGFLKSLTAIPPNYYQSPSWKKPFLRAQHIFRKIGWLLLKALRLR